MKLTLKKERLPKGYRLYPVGEASIKHLQEMPVGSEFSFEIEEPGKQRTLTQNKALHLYCAQLATALNEGGYSQENFFKECKLGFSLPWTMGSIKNIFRVCADAMYEKESTARLTTDEISEVYRAFDNRISELTGVHIEWPDKFGGM